MDNNNKRGGPAEAKQNAAIYKTPAALADWILELVEAWSARDKKVYAIAEGGRCCAITPEDNGNVEASIFEVIEDQVNDTRFALNLKACIDRMKQLAQSERGAET